MADILLQRQDGTTLIDLVVALALLSMAITSAGAFATASSRISGEAGRRTQATALASREMEGLRAYRDATGKSPGANWIFKPDTGTGIPGSCQKFVMQRTKDTWSTLSSTGLKPYTAADDDGDRSFGANYGSFSRLVTACDARDYSQSGSVKSEKVKRVQVRVQWSESNGPTREVRFETLLTKWGPS